MLWLSLISLAFLDSSSNSRVDFDTQVMPILTQAGCNSGACHGAAAGRGGFHLSLYGSRPQEDFDEITRSLEGRRINLRDSELSLILLKPTEQVAHEGGLRLEAQSRDFETLQRWIAEGARRTESRDVRSLTLTVEKLKTHADLQGFRKQFQLKASATFTDDSTADVLPWTVLTPDDPEVIDIDAEGGVCVKQPGRHLIIARYLDQVRSLELIVPLTETPAPDDAATSSSQPPAASLSDHKPADTNGKTNIDKFIDRRLAELGLTADSAIDDAAFIRRVTLDLTGSLPSPESVNRFVCDSSDHRRIDLIDQLLMSDDFVDFWTFRFALLLRVPQTKSNPQAAKAYSNWLRNCVRFEMPLNQIADELLVAEGSISEYGPANFFNVAGDARSQAEFVSQIFMGVRLQCANCHDHPFDAWTQDDYHGLAAIFARVKRGPNIHESKSGSVMHPATLEPAIARIPGVRSLALDTDYRKEFARWLTADDNPLFARAISNRIWGYLMGRGLVEPVDDLRVTNPATHPELLEWLSQDFATHKFQLRHLIRCICSSEAYARRACRNADRIRMEFYASATPKPMSPEVFLDAVDDVTGAKAGASNGERAISLQTMMSDSAELEALGLCRDDCESDAVNRVTPTVQLQLINGEVLNSRLSSEEGLLMKAVHSGQLREILIRDFYLRAFSRLPCDEEFEFWKKQFRAGADTTQVSEIAQDFLWSLLSSQEFSTNH